MRPGHVGKVKVELWLDQADYDRLAALAASLGRTLLAEGLDAISRHLRAPPRLIKPKLPPVPPAEEGAAPRQAKPRKAK